MKSTEEDREIVKNLDGLYVAVLTEEEIERFARCVADGFAIRNFNHEDGFIGYAKVKIIK